jgi:hypothetical protein
MAQSLRPLASARKLCMYSFVQPLLHGLGSAVTPRCWQALRRTVLVRARAAPFQLSAGRAARALEAPRV